MRLRHCVNLMSKRVNPHRILSRVKHSLTRLYGVIALRRIQAADESIADWESLGSINNEAVMLAQGVEIDCRSVCKVAITDDFRVSL